MFGPRLRRLHRLHRLNRLHRLDRLAHVADPVLAFASNITGNGPWGRREFRPRRRGPSIARLLLAGLAVLALAKVMSAASGGHRSRAEKILLAGLLVVLGAIVMSFRRSAVRRGW